MNPQTLGLYGGIAGKLTGMLGGIVDGDVWLANMNGPREREFVLRCTALLWAVMAVSLTTGFLLPTPFGSLALLPLFLTIPWLIRGKNRRQEALRNEDSAPDQDGGRA